MPTPTLQEFEQSLLSENPAQRAFELQLLNNQDFANFILNLHFNLYSNPRPHLNIARQFLRSQQMQIAVPQTMINQEIIFNIDSLATSIFGTRPLELSEEEKNTRISWFQHFLNKNFSNFSNKIIITKAGILNYNFKKINIIFTDRINSSNQRPGNALAIAAFKKSILKISNLIIDNIKAREISFKYNDQLLPQETFYPDIFHHIIEQRQKLPFINFEITQINRDEIIDPNQDRIQNALNVLDSNIDPALIAINRLITTSRNFNNCYYLTNQEFLEKLEITGGNIDLEKLAQIIKNNKNLRFLSYGGNTCINTSVLESLKHSKIQELQINSNLQLQDILAIFSNIDDDLKTLSFNITSESLQLNSITMQNIEEIIANNTVLETLDISLSTPQPLTQPPFELIRLVLLCNLVRKELQESEIFKEFKELKEFNVNFHSTDEMMRSTTQALLKIAINSFISNNPTTIRHIKEEAKEIAQGIIIKKELERLEEKTREIKRKIQKIKRDIKDKRDIKAGKRAEQAPEKEQTPSSQPHSPHYKELQGQEIDRTS